MLLKNRCAEEKVKVKLDCEKQTKQLNKKIEYLRKRISRIEKITKEEIEKLNEYEALAESIEHQC